MSFRFFFPILLLIVRCVFSRNCTVKSKLSMKGPAYVSVVKVTKTSEFVLFVSHFTTLSTHGKVFAIRNFTQTFDDFSHARLVELESDHDFIWPNEIGFCDASAMGEEGVFVPNGFLIPTKETGSVYFKSIEGDDAGTKGKAELLFEKKREYFYHRAVCFDMLEDGKSEILTARVKVNLIEDQSGFKSDGEMLISTYEQNSGDVRILSTFKGPQTMFGVNYVPYLSKKPVVISSAFFYGELNYYTAEDWSNASTITKHVLMEGQAFDGQFVDLNNDGNADVVTVMQEMGGEGYVYALNYDFHSNSSDDWNVHQIAGPFEAKGKQNGAPGMIRPIIFNENEKPSLFLGGDDGGSMYLLNPVSEAPDDWRYETIKLYDTKISQTTAGHAVYYDVDSGRIYIVSCDFSGDALVLFECQ